MDALRKVGRTMFPKPKKSADGRDEWPSRTPYVLASMGGAMGFGNLLRFPSQVFNNNGIQWFIPYVMSIALLAIPVLVLEVALGQAYRTGCVVGYNSLDRRFTGVGLGMVCVGYIVTIYYIPILSWIMVYFRNSFQSADSFPWRNNPQAYFDEVVGIVPANEAIIENGNVVRYASYPSLSLNGELVGWTMFSWLVVWLCLWKGVAITARVVWVTIALPIFMTIVLLGRGVSLPNATDGIKLYFGEFNGDQLARGQIWQAAVGQVFYSTGVGFGYFTAYASYNSKFADAVQDAALICCSNALFETVAAFAVFGIVGYIGLTPGQGDPVGTYSLGFYTIPTAISRMPGAPAWAVIFFLTIFLLGVSSSFALLDAMITTICDTDWGSKYKHSTIATGAVIVSALLSLMYLTDFGYAWLNNMDMHVNNVSLIFVVWSECAVSTSFYRWTDVMGQVGPIAFWVHQVTYIGSMVLGNVVAHTVSASAGAGLGFGLYIVGTVASVFLAKEPTSRPPRFWGSNKLISSWWWLGAYSGNQLKRDLNYVVCMGGQWKIPVYWAPILRYFGAPVLSIVFSFAYPAFYPNRGDPTHIFGFAVAHLVLVVVLVCFVFPRFLNPLVPKHRQHEGNREYAPQVVLGKDDPNLTGGYDPSGDDIQYDDKEKDELKA